MAKRRKTLKNGMGYDPVREEVHISQLVRRHPSIEVLNQNQKRRVDYYAENYRNFISGMMIPSDAVDEALDMASAAKFYQGRNFRMLNDERTAFALVKFGTRPTKEGLRIIYSHCDSPCLRLKQNPLKFEWDLDWRDHHLGVELDSFGYGGVHPYQWKGTTLRVVGWAFVNGRRRSISFDVFAADIAPHTDKRRERDTSYEAAHKREFSLVPGHPSKKSFLKSIGFSEHDFARAKLYAVPEVEPKRLLKYYITGYGHDDRAGVFASVQAFLESNPRYTTIVLGFDNEEVGSSGSGGAKSNFFEQVVNEVIAVSEKISLESITTGLREELYRRSLAIDADVDVGSTDMEIENVDPNNVAKLSYGFFVSAMDGMMEGDQQSPKLVDRIITALQKKKVLLQTIGSAVPAGDNESDNATMNKFFADRGIATINCGVPVGSLHSMVEIIHAGDLYHSIRGYKALVEDPRTMGPRLRRTAPRKESSMKKAKKKKK